MCEFAAFLNVYKYIYAGLLQGAHANRGLGHKFLRHIERTKALVFVLDGSPESDNGKPWEQLHTLRQELAQYSPDLLALPSIVAVNKSDLMNRPAAMLSALKKHSATEGVDAISTVAVSAATGAGVEALTEQLEQLFSKIVED